MSTPTMNDLDKLRSVFHQVFDVPSDVDVDALRYREFPRWDSVAHMQLVASIEAAFDLMLDTDDVIALSSFAKARELLRKYDVHADP